MLLEATRQFDAASGAVVVSKESLQQSRIAAHVRDGRLEEPPYPISVPMNGSSFGDRFTQPTEPMYLDVEQQSEESWPGMLAFNRQEGYNGSVVYPLVFGSRNVGFLILRFRRNAADVQRSELLVALAQQATLAVQLTRLAYQAKEAAGLVERARIGQEIHDGLAQAFTGILMQLGAVEEFPSCKEELGLGDHAHAHPRPGARRVGRGAPLGHGPQARSTRRAGLEFALRQLAERSTVPGGVTSNFEGGGITTGIKPEHEHELLRIAQEAVSNAMRHARPKLIRITMTDRTDWVLAVEDDGRGMEQRPELYARGGFGLTSMRQRAGAIGGEWQIDRRNLAPARG